MVLGGGRVRGVGSQSAVPTRHSGDFHRRDAVPRDRIALRMIRDLLRLRLAAGLSQRQAARSAGVPRSAVQDDVARFRASGLP